MARAMFELDLSLRPHIAGAKTDAATTGDNASSQQSELSALEIADVDLGLKRPRDELQEHDDAERKRPQPTSGCALESVPCTSRTGTVHLKLAPPAAVSVDLSHKHAGALRDEGGVRLFVRDR